ncbi:sensor histidine kinase [Chitinophaga sp. MM2321]|uniref:sensor histidine kinase n=1 Tax=Chitinophaga sp. MM2321 TaxID=3137178 RepID=UPI0032D576A4
MNFKESEPLFSSKIFLYLSRMLILYTFSIIFKSFDHTFVQGLRMLDFRGQMFSVVYVLFGLLVWEGAVWLARAIEKRIAGKQAPQRLAILCCSLMFYGMLSAFCFGFLYAVMDILLFERYEAWEAFKAFSYDLNFGIFMFYVLILAFNGIVFYYSGWKEYQVQAERLMRENIQAKYDALRNQIDPHFFFNSLSVLTNLVYKSPDLSADYITQLAKTYRYILDKKFENLVTVQTELDFLESYIFLMRIRHQQSIQFKVEIDEVTRQKGMIPPVSLQLLIENAIKHNRFSANDPLLITVKGEDGYLIVANHIRKKNNPDLSSGIGLENIQKRYALISERSLEIQQSEGMFIVKIPIINHA